MARYLGPTCKLARREGKDLSLKSGVRALTSKCKLDNAPGQHGQRRGRLSDYGLQLRQKQTLRRIYGVSERQFRRYYQKAAHLVGATGPLLLQFLEQRLDNIVYRLGFATTRAEARQLVSHRAVMVNGRVVNVASFLVKEGDAIALTERAQTQGRVIAALELAQQRSEVEWLDVDASAKKGLVKRLPRRDDLPSEYNEQLVVELYSK